MSEPTKPTKRKTDPHHRMTIQDVVTDFREGLITVKGAIFYGVSASAQHGKPVRIQPNQLANTLGVARSTIYRKIAELKVQGRIEFETEGAIAITIPITPNQPNDNIFLGKLSHLDHTLSQNCDKLSHLDHTQSHLDHTQSHLDHTQSHLDHTQSHLDHTQSHECNKKALEQALEADSEALHLCNYSSLSTNQERERNGDTEELDPEYREWLVNKANALPTKPALLEQWIKKQAKVTANQREFEQYQAQKRQYRVNSSAAAAAIQNLEILPSDLREAIAARDIPRTKDIAASRGIPFGDIAHLVYGSTPEEP
jgi:hypothetical protein